MYCCLKAPVRLLICNPVEFLPQFDHGVGIELAVFEQIVSGAGLLFRRHILDLREDGHRFGAVMNVLQVVVVERRVVREERRQYAFDRETAAHGAVVIPAGLKGDQKVDDVICDILKMIGKIGEQAGQLSEPRTLESFVVGGHTDVLRDVPAKRFRDRPQRICAGFCQELFVQQRAAFVFDEMERILEGDLRIRFRPNELRDRELHRFEVEEVQWIGQFIEKFPDMFRIDMRFFFVKSVFDLPHLAHILDGRVALQLFKFDLAGLIQSELFAEPHIV